MRVENLDIRVLIMCEGLQYQSIARQMKITPEYLCRIMTKPLTENMRNRILRAVEELNGEGQSGNNSL